MAVKTITIDLEAYNLLAKEKREKESFSRVIKRRLRPVHTTDNLLRNLDKISLSESTLDRAEEIIRARRDSLADSPVIEKE